MVGGHAVCPGAGFYLAYMGRQVTLFTYLGEDFDELRARAKTAFLRTGGPWVVYRPVLWECSGSELIGRLAGAGPMGNVLRG